MTAAHLVGWGILAAISEGMLWFIATATSEPELHPVRTWLLLNAAILAATSLVLAFIFAIVLVKS